MTQRLDNVGIVVDDLEAATAFFTELGLELDGKTAVEGRWVDSVIGLDGVRAGMPPAGMAPALQDYPAAIPTTGRFSGWPPIEPENRALPKANTPPSAATSQ